MKRNACHQLWRRVLVSPCSAIEELIQESRNYDQHTANNQK